jgi:hypothetical protein
MVSEASGTTAIFRSVSEATPAPLNLDDPAVRLKLDMLRKAMPAEDAIVFGDIWGVEGAYSMTCLEYGCSRVTLIDVAESVNWLERRQAHPFLNHYKGDFSDPLFMASIREEYEVGVAYDVILHQASLLHALHLMLEKVTDRFCVVQPMLREQEYPNTVVFLPGNRARDELHPLGPDAGDWLMFDPELVNSASWLWGMTPSFLVSALRSEGFDVVEEQELDDGFPNPRWMWWGCVAHRGRDVHPEHWSHHARTRKVWPSGEGPG